MRRTLALVLLLGLVAAAPADAKPRPVRVEACGASGCARGPLPDLGHLPPLYGLTEVSAPTPAPYHVVEVEFDNGELLRLALVGRWLAAEGRWYEAAGALADSIRTAARTVTPFPPPRLRAAHRALLELEEAAPMPLGRDSVPLSGTPLRLRGARLGPWTGALAGYYYPAEDVLCRSFGDCVHVPESLARELEAVGEEGDSWHQAAALLAAIAVGLVLAALMARGRIRRRRSSVELRKRGDPGTSRRAAV